MAAGDTVAVRYVIEARTRGISWGSPPPVAGCAGDAVDIYRLAGGMIAGGVTSTGADDRRSCIGSRGVHRPTWARLQSQRTARRSRGDQDRGGRPGQGQSGGRAVNRRRPLRLRRQDRSGVEVEEASQRHLLPILAGTSPRSIRSSGSSNRAWIGWSAPGHPSTSSRRTSPWTTVVTVPGVPAAYRGAVPRSPSCTGPYGTMIILDRCFDLAVHHDTAEGVVVLEYASEGHVAGRRGGGTPTGISPCSRSARAEVAHGRDYLDPVARA